MERGRTGVVGRLGRVAVACAWAGTAAAAEDPPGGSAGAPPRVDLEKLLELPGDVRYDVEKKGGATQGEWRARFQKVRGELARERAVAAIDLALVEEGIDIGKKMMAEMIATYQGPPSTGEKPMLNEVSPLTARSASEG